MNARKWNHACGHHPSFFIFLYLYTFSQLHIQLWCKYWRWSANHWDALSCMLSFLCIWWNVVRRLLWRQEGTWNQSWMLHSITTQFHYARELCVHINISRKLDSNATNHSDFLSPTCGTARIRVHVPCTNIECTTAGEIHPARCAAILMTNERSNHRAPPFPQY